MDSKTINLLAQVTNGVEPAEDAPDSTYEAIALDMLRAGQLATLTDEVKRHYASLRQTRHWDTQRWNRMYYLFLQPLPANVKPKVVNETKDIKFVEKPVKQAWKVRRPDLEAFAKSHKLNSEQMRLVGEGEIGEHKGWVRKPGMGDPLLIGRDFHAPAPEQPPIPADGRQEVRVVFRYEAPATEFVPDK